VHILERGNADGVRYYYMKTVHLATKLRLTDRLPDRAFPEKNWRPRGVAIAMLISSWPLCQATLGLSKRRMEGPATRTRWC
jgi:hypothetical protein